MIIKCKMCGGDIQFNPGDTNGQCDHCGCTTTFPKLPDEQRTNLFNRANHFRRQCEFDKAMAAYEHILEEDDTDAEAHWGIVLSKFGIEYVEDPVTHERIPTCHRAQVISILSDEDYQNALKYAPDTYSREIYEKEAKRIAEIQKGILAISSKEKPYDVFICYKETDDSGNRTKDSTLAQEIYYQLTNEGYKVFFSRITLEDKLGQEYEPYIFAALNSAKVMLVVGTRPEFFNAVWVKNEWGRYLKLMKNDRKRLLIPCYRDMDPYDLPDELSNLQSQNMNRIGFMQDLLRGILKVLEAEKITSQATVQQVTYELNSNVNALLDRAFMALEDGDFDKADEFCEQALNLDAKNSRAYLGKLMVELKVRMVDQLAGQGIPLESNKNYQKSIRFANAEQKRLLEGWNWTIIERNERNKKAQIRDEALVRLEKATTVAQCEEIRNDLEVIRDFEDVKAAQDACDRKAVLIQEKKYKDALTNMEIGQWQEAMDLFRTLKGYRDSNQKIRECEESIREEQYNTAFQYEKNGELEKAIVRYQQMGNYRDCVARIQECKKTLTEMERQREEEEEQKRLIVERKAKETERKKKRLIIALIALAVLIAVTLVLTKIINDKANYDRGVSMRANGQWELAVKAFQQAGNYSDAEDQILETRYQEAKSYYNNKDYTSSYRLFLKLSGYKDVDSILTNDDNLVAIAVKQKSLRTIGDIVKFGYYEQDNNSLNGPEEIEWIVLDVQNGKSLLLSRYGLDVKAYHNERVEITWEDCTLRSWLNKDFLNNAFTTEEQSAIITTMVDNSSSQVYSRWSTKGGNNTEDRIFLLSYYEAFDLYFSDYQDRMCVPTDYAINQGAWPNSNFQKDGRSTGWWWLRSPGYTLVSAAVVNHDGFIDERYVQYDSGCIRPAFWINLETDIF